MELMNHTKKNGAINLKEKYEHFAHQLQEAVKKITEQALEESGEKISQATKEVQKNVKKNPWAYIGAASAVALLAGFLLGRKK